MNIMQMSLGGFAAYALAAVSAPAAAQQTEPETGLSYCSRTVQDNCIQRVDIQRNKGVKRLDPAMTAGPSTPEPAPAPTEPDMRAPGGPETMPAPPADPALPTDPPPPPAMGAPERDMAPPADPALPTDPVPPAGMPGPTDDMPPPVNTPM